LNRYQVWADASSMESSALDEIRHEKRAAVPANQLVRWHIGDKKTIYDLVKTGEIPSIRVGVRHFVPMVWVRRFAGLDDLVEVEPFA
jgi:hypothetical protein